MAQQCNSRRFGKYSFTMTLLFCTLFFSKSRVPDFQKAGCPLFKNSGCRFTGRVCLGRYFGMIFFDDSNSWFEDSRGWTWSGELPKILIYPNFDPMGISRVQKFKMKIKQNKTYFRPKITSQRTWKRLRSTCLGVNVSRMSTKLVLT